MSAIRRMKPVNATWLAKAKVSADHSIDFLLEGGTGHEFAEVDLSWYDEGRLKITIPRGTPGVIRQAYLTGNERDLIIEVAPRGSDQPRSIQKRMEAAEDLRRLGEAAADLAEADEHERGVGIREREVLLQQEEGKTP